MAVGPNKRYLAHTQSSLGEHGLYKILLPDSVFHDPHIALRHTHTHSTLGPILTPQRNA